MLRKLVFAVALSLASAPAMAGQVTVTLSPSTAEESAALRLGLALYALSRNQPTGALVRQSGRDNLALLSQSGQGNFAVIRQRGNGHTAQVRQTGHGLGAVVIQSGRNSVATVEQTPSSQPVIVIQHGW